MPLSKRPQLNRDYSNLKFQASVMYIKYGLSADAIHQKLNIAMQTISTWRRAGKWDELRPDLEVLNEYKAAKLYVKDNLTSGEIAMRLSIPEGTVKMWIDLNG